MTLLPHDVTDVLLAPVVLHVDERLEQYGKMTRGQLREEVAVLADMPDRTRPQRQAALLRALSHHHELHGWTLNLDDRGVRLTHAGRSITLGLPLVVCDYLDGTW